MRTTSCALVWRLLHCGIINLRARPAFHCFFVDIVDHSDHPVFLFISHEDFSYCVLAGPVEAGGRCVDQDDSSRYAARRPR